MIFCDYTKETLKRFHLNDYITKEQYLVDPDQVKNKLLDSKGVYFVIHPYDWKDDMFITLGTGGYFKGKNPNVPKDELRLNWVEGADILYIGKAGGIDKNGRASNATLKKRIIALLKFGCGKNVGHWGGRYLWQHEASKSFRIYWHECSDENPVQLERESLDDFIAEYGIRPFANLR